jgi:AbrB family looped-hinge helix DNA binding protein
MNTLATTRLSSKGQVVIPEDIRQSMNLKTGAQFIVIGKGDAIVFKKISEPLMDDFKDLLDAARMQAKKAGMKKSDIQKAILNVRGKK